MASIKYLLKNKTETSTIYIRFRHGRKHDYTKSTSLLVDYKYWNLNKGTVKQIASFTEKKNLQNDLNNLKNHILNTFNNVYTIGGVINSQWLSNTIDEFFNHDNKNDLNHFIEFTEYFKETLNTKVLNNGKTGVSANTLKRHTTIINKFREFETYKKRRYLFTDIDLKFYIDFKHYLTNVNKLNLNTTGRYINYVKTLCREAKNYGIKIHSDIEKKEFRATKQNVSFITLDENEIETIHKHKFNTPYLENARQWLVISVWTGARVSDLLNFTKQNVTNGFLEYTSQKTNQKIIIGLHPHVKQILEANNNEFPRKISSTKYNVYIKEVCKQVDIIKQTNGHKKTKLKNKTWRKTEGVFPKHELVSSHIGRRSFATNHYGKLPTPVIMAITGHKTEKMLLNYIGKTAKDNAEVLNSYWQNLEQKKNQTKPKLKVIKTGTN
jgi:integrase